MDTKIYQIFYRENQKDSLDPAFIPHNNKGQEYPFNFEYAVFFDLYKNVNWASTNLLGTVSWKFHQKTGLNGNAISNHITKNPGMDVYFINPFPELCIYQSVWRHGDEFHPNLIKLTTTLLKECGYTEDILARETPPNLTAYCNYWIANKTFWDAYIDFLTPLWNYILQNDNSITKSIQQSADPFIKAPYLPFIFERLFSTFLSINKFKVSSIPIDSGKLQDNPYLSPISGKILKVSELDCHHKLLFFDKFAITLLAKIRKLRHYYAPLIVRKIKKLI